MYEGFILESKEEKLKPAPEPPKDDITDEQVDELYKVCNKMASKAKSLLNGKYKMLKKGSVVEVDKWYDGTRKLDFISFNLWDVNENAREYFRDTPESRAYFKALDDFVRELRHAAPKGYSVDINGDWDTFEMVLITYK